MKALRYLSSLLEPETLYQNSRGSSSNCQSGVLLSRSHSTYIVASVRESGRVCAVIIDESIW